MVSVVISVAWASRPCRNAETWARRPCYWSCRGAGSPLQEVALARAALVLVVLDDHFAARQHRFRQPLDLHALKEAVVAVHVVRLRAERPLALVVEDDDVGVGADGDRALLREHAEHLRRRRRRQVDELVEREPALDDAAVVYERQPILHARPAVRDFSEVAAAELLLALEVEGAVIR